MLTKETNHLLAIEMIEMCKKMNALSKIDIGSNQFLL